MPKPRPYSALFLAAVTALGTAGCASSAPAPGEGGTPNAQGRELELVTTSPERSAPVEEVSWLLGGEPAGFDTDRAGGDSEDTVVANVCERLFMQNPDLTVTPWLATEFEQSDETLVLTLRDDVTFHDGSPVTADDVVYSLQRHAEEGNEEADEFANVSAIRKSAENEVTLELKRPDSQIVAALAGDAGIVLSQETVQSQGQDYGTPGSEDACSGPYRIANWSAGSSLTVEKYADYWNEDFTGGPERVTFRWAESAATVNTLQAGEADGTYLSSPSLVPVLADVDSLELYFGPSTMVYSLVPTHRGIMTNPDVRKALSLALDRTGIAQAAFQGYAEPARLPVGAGAWGYEKAAFEAAYENVEAVPASPTDEQVEQAKALVEEADAAGETVIVASDGSPYRTVMTNAVKSAGEKIGLDVEIETFSEAAFDEFYGDASARAAVDLVPVGWYISKADPTGFYDNMVSGGGNNWIDFSSETYDEAVAQAQATTDPAERAEHVLAVQNEFMEQMLWIPVAEVPNTLVLNDELTGAPVSVAYLNYPWAAELGRS